ncbi:MAG: hypothetical protein IIU50_00155 [Bacteroidaceae bacterium]|nr:hypothetical protein [Bacteroidaceae bacterium]MBQ5369950.1 hypothetical protein [Bacteroidaceae bacterium]MBQ5826192.1 hypothetical protein [Bacteroidaceae bacterium]
MRETPAAPHPLAQVTGGADGMKFDLGEMPISQTKTFLKFRDVLLKKGLGFFEKD